VSRGGARRVLETFVFVVGIEDDASTSETLADACGADESGEVCVLLRVGYR
jgi:hypothetical protein